MYIIEDKGFLIIDPPIDLDHDWDMDKTMKCLEVIRNKLPEKFLDFPKSISYKLVRYGDFLGNLGQRVDLLVDVRRNLGRVDVRTKTGHFG